MNLRTITVVFSVVGVLMSLMYFNSEILYGIPCRLSDSFKRDKNENEESYGTSYPDFFECSEQVSSSSDADSQTSSKPNALSASKRNANIKYRKKINLQNLNGTILNFPSCCLIKYHPKKKQWLIHCSKIMKYGYPSTDNVYFRDKYVLSYNNKHKQPNWVMEIIGGRKFHDYDISNPRSACTFVSDPDIPIKFSSFNEDYFNSGFDRGHLAAFANHTTHGDNNCSTFLLSNVSPQTGIGFNRNIWEQLEAHVRMLNKKQYKKVYVCTGPLYMPTNGIPKKVIIYKTIGNNVSVPTHFFKVILGVKPNQVFEVESFIIPNEVIDDSNKLESFRVYLDEVERASGLEFFNQIPPNLIFEVQNEIKAVRKSVSRPPSK